MSFPTCDPSFLTFVDQLKSADNSVRSQAEEQFKTLQEQDAYQLLNQLFGAYAVSQPQIRAYVAILIKKLITLLTWNAFNNEQRQCVHQLCIQAFQNESDNYARHQLSNVIASVSGLEGDWPELLPCLYTACTQSNPDIQCEGIYILGEMSDYCPDLVLPISNEIFNIFKQCIESKNIKIQISVCKAVLTFIMCNSEQPKNVFLDLLSNCLMILKSIVNQPDYEEDLLNILVSLGDICRICYKHLTKFIPTIVEIMLTLVNMDISMDIIKQAYEVIISVAENSSNFMRKNTNAMNSILNSIYKYLCMIDEDEDWVQGSYGTEEEMQDTYDLPYLMAESILERFSLCVRGAALYKSITSTISQFLKSEHWNERRAAFSIIWCIADACAKNMEKDLNVWYTFIRQGLNDVHPRINFAALYSLTGLCLALTPSIQKNYGSYILKDLLSLIERNPCPRVQGHLASSLLSFFTCEKMNRNVYKAHIDAIMKFLLSLCSVKLFHSQPNIQTEAIQAINSIAMCIKTAFASYFPVVMNGLKSIIDGPLTSDNLDLHKSAYECIGSLLVNIHVDQIQAEAPSILVYLCNILFNLDNSDLRIPILLDVISNIYDIVKTGKEEILTRLIPPVLQLATIDIELSASTLVNDIETEQEEKEGVETMTYEVKNLGTVSVSVNTHNMELKYYALGAIYKFIEYGGEEIMPYIDSIYQVVFPLIQFKFYAAIRSLASEIVACLLYTYIKINQKRGTLDVPTATNMVQTVVQTIVTQYADEGEEEDREGMSSAFSTILKACLETGDCIDGTYRNAKIHLPQEYNDDLIATFVSYLRDSVTAVTEYNETIDKEDREQEEQIDELEDMISTEKDNLEHLIDSLGYIIKLENLNIMNSFNEHVLPMVNDFLKNNLEIIQFVGICPIDDLFEYSSTESIATLIPIYLPFMIQNTVSKDPFLRQASLFGLKVCLERHTEHCKSSLENIINALSDALSSPDCTDEMYASCTDNALSALIVLVKKYGSTFNAPQYKQMVKAILNYIPAVSDVVESKVIHARIVDEVLLGTNGMFNTPDLLKEAQSKLPGLLVPNVIDEEDEDEDTRITSLETQQTIVQYLKQLPSYNQFLKKYGPDELKWIKRKMN